MPIKEASNCPFFAHRDIASVWEHIHRYCELVAATPKEQKKFLRFVLDVLKADICESALSRKLYENAQDLHALLPITPAPGTVEASSKRPSESISVIHMPYQSRKGSKWTGVYIPEIDLLLIQDRGRHSAASSARESIEVCRLSDSFDRLSVSQDFRFWMVNGEPTTEIVDHRFALLYKLAQELAS